MSSIGLKKHKKAYQLKECKKFFYPFYAMFLISKEQNVRRKKCQNVTRRLIHHRRPQDPVS